MPSTYLSYSEERLLRWKIASHTFATLDFSGHLKDTTLTHSSTLPSLAAVALTNLIDSRCACPTRRTLYKWFCRIVACRSLVSSCFTTYGLAHALNSRHCLLNINRFSSSKTNRQEQRRYIFIIYLSNSIRTRSTGRPSTTVPSIATVPSLPPHMLFKIASSTASAHA